MITGVKTVNMAIEAYGLVLIRGVEACTVVWCNPATCYKR